MTEAQISIEEDGHANLLIQLDASSAFESREFYFNASQIVNPLNNNTIKHILERILSSIELRVVSNNSIETFATHEAWQIKHLLFLEKNKLAYFDLLNWPKIEIAARSKEILEGESLAVKFKTDFIFEEPIALTLNSFAQEHPKTRWLIAYQHSPAIALNAQASKSFPLLEQDDKQNSVFYFLQGVKHVLPFGYDHLLFVAALAFAFLGKKALALMLSVFTLAHCVTLLISVYGLLRIPSSIVEPAIALSIAWAGFQLIRNQKRPRPPYLVIALFGLLHGLGFAGALSELGLPTSGTLIALIAFNLGIELGQLCAMLISVGIVFFYSRYLGATHVLRTSLGYAIFVIGILWTALRLLV